MMLASAGPPHCWEHLSTAQLGFAAAAAGAICESDRCRFLDICKKELLQACATGKRALTGDCKEENAMVARILPTRCGNA